MAPAWHSPDTPGISLAHWMPGKQQSSSLAESHLFQPFNLQRAPPPPPLPRWPRSAPPTCARLPLSPPSLPTSLSGACGAATQRCAGPCSSTRLCMQRAGTEGPPMHLGPVAGLRARVGWRHVYASRGCLFQACRLPALRVQDEIVPLCRELGIGIVAYSPLGR
jgi:hypothetical protein